MKANYILIVITYLSLCNRAHSDCTVNINYGGKDNITTCVIKDESTAFCTKRGLLVTGKDHRIADKQMTASSTYPAPGHEAPQARLFNTKGYAAWVAKDNLPDQWIQFDLGKRWTILAAVTRGRYDDAQWVTSYKVQYAANVQQYADGIWKEVMYKPAPEITPTDPKIFPGNHDRETMKVNYFDEPIEAQYVRIYPVSSYNIHRSMRADLIGCFGDE